MSFPDLIFNPNKHCFPLDGFTVSRERLRGIGAHGGPGRRQEPLEDRAQRQGPQHQPLCQVHTFFLYIFLPFILF